jgi:putative peptidoglycan lipid II flippase
VFVWLGLGTTGGVAVTAMMLTPALGGGALRLRPRLDWRHPAVAELLSLSRWTAGHAIVNQIDNFFVIAVAFNLPEDGAATAYALAWMTWIAPHGLVAGALLTTLTPEFARLAQRPSLGPLRRAWTAGLRVTTLAMLPASVGLTVAAYPLLRVVPYWSPETADSVAAVLQLIGPGLVSYSVFLYTLRVFYALGDTRTPFWINLIQNLVHVVLAIPLGVWLGARGLGLLSTVAYSVGAVLGFAAAARRLGRVPIGEVRPIVSMAAAAVAMGLVVAAALALLRWGDREMSAWLEVAVCALVGPVAYAAYLWAFGADGEAHDLLARIRSGR